jgi:hypothetical protein
MAHACNLSYLGGRDQEDCKQREVSPDRKLVILSITTNKPGEVVHVYIPS